MLPSVTHSFSATVCKHSNLQPFPRRSDRFVRRNPPGGNPPCRSVPAALVVFLVWPRARYFGNAAPLIMAFLFLLQRVLSPHTAGSVFGMTAVLFLFVFIAGIIADLLENKSLETLSALLVGLVAANALWDLVGLARIGH